MRASLAVLLALFAVAYGQVASGQHNQAILSELLQHKVDDYIVHTSVITPDIVVNEFKTQGQDIKKILLDHIKIAADQFKNLANSDPTNAGNVAVSLPVPSNKATLGVKGSKKKRDTLDVDIDATAELYRQTIEFLNNYDVELRYD